MPGVDHSIGRSTTPVRSGTLAYARRVAAGASQIIPDLPIIRTRAEGEQRATFFELFFDLVYVYAITQLSHLLLGHPTVKWALETLFLLLVVWWAWQYTTWSTNWFGPEALPVRLMLVAVMLASLVMSVAIPGAFGERGLPLLGILFCLQIGG